MKFRKKPVVIEAVQLTWANWSELCEFAEKEFDEGIVLGGVKNADGSYTWGRNAEPSDSTTLAFRIETLEGIMYADENDWIIRGVQGELYPCKPDIFDQTYDPVGE